jgi:protein associated with RNAse G/E
MDNLKNNIIRFNNTDYFVIDETSIDYNVYDLIINISNESDIKIIRQEVFNGKNVFVIENNADIINKIKEKFKTSLNI